MKQWNSERNPEAEELRQWLETRPNRHPTTKEMQQLAQKELIQGEAYSFLNYVIVLIHLIAIILTLATWVSTGETSLPWQQIVVNAGGILLSVLFWYTNSSEKHKRDVTYRVFWLRLGTPLVTFTLLWINSY